MIQVIQTALREVRTGGTVLLVVPLNYDNYPYTGHVARFVCMYRSM